MKILVDMNLSPDWCSLLGDHGMEAMHWSRVGDPQAPDTDILWWAENRGYIILTHDLDFGAILAASSGTAPSVVLLRMDDVIPATAGALVASILVEHKQLLINGALLCIEPATQSNSSAATAQKLSG